ncbi:MAG: hypothetical protein GY870_15225 [archaeon]|nr:hypothetical protein [archaeon]
MHFFEILFEDGLQRRCRFLTGVSKKSKKWVKTPLIIVPINDFLIKFDGYIDLIERNPNISLQTYQFNQKIPKNLSNLSIFCNSNNNYYTQDGKPEEYIDFQSISEEESDIVYIASKNCPSSSFSDGFKNAVMKDFENELLSQMEEYEEKLNSGDKNSSNNKNIKEIGLSFTFHYQRSYLNDMKIAIDLINNPKLVNIVKIVNISGLFDNFMYFEDIIEAFYLLKESIPSDILIMVSGKLIPSQFALLSYLGVDIIDGTYLIYSGFSDQYYIDGEMIWKRKIKDLDDISCSCESCLQLLKLFNKNLSEIEISDDYSMNNLLALHNFESAINEMKKIRKKIYSGTLRAYLEKMSMSSTFQISAIRYLDNMKPNPFIEIQRNNKNNQLICSTTLSYHEPQIVKYRKMVNERFIPNENAKLCVLLPCSMRKPYSQSKSHKKFRKILKKAGRDYPKIQQIIVTSPLGVVPREIEEIYPASHYDISVTGEWDNEEIEITADCISSFLNKLPKNMPIIAHLHGGYLDSFNKAIKLIDYPLSNISISSSLEELEAMMKSEMEKINSAVIQPDKKVKITDSLSQEEVLIDKISDFQFGLGAGKLLIGTSARFLLSRNEKYKEIMGFESYGKIMLGRYDRSSGKIRLSLEGGERISKLSGNCLKLNISLSELRGTTVFHPILEEVDDLLCSGDEVIIKDIDGKYIGIGNMLVNAHTAKNFRKGPIAKIRKKKKMKKE